MTWSSDTYLATIGILVSDVNCFEAVFTEFILTPAVGGTGLETVLAGTVGTPADADTSAHFAGICKSVDNGVCSSL